MSNGDHQNRLNESLSALVDGEASELELQRLLKASATSAEIGERWSRYQLAASVMRRERIAKVNPGLAAGVSMALERELPLSAQAASDGIAVGDTGYRRTRRMLTRGAVAATVAFAAILGVQQLPESPGSAELVATAERPVQPPVQSVQQPSGFYVPAPTARAVSTAMPRLVPERQGDGPGQAFVQQLPTPELMRHLNRVMVEHSEQAAELGNQGMVPFVRATFAEQGGN
ncbi:sigma-E factor negative regulatory protein [Microbulbifer sp. TYP-18]|uniref:sigma-E factor negative regulatory protein n=1 Tax=Microbulbifer sp. TYP-18 TaxID=3230024 RepID=UPI0034C62C56